MPVRRTRHAHAPDLPTGNASRRRHSPRSSSERGQATPLWAAVLLCAGLLLIPTSKVVRATVDRAQARTAADAAALAGALHGEAMARSIAADNRGEVIEYRPIGTFIEVVVRVGSRKATARAERQEIVIPWNPPTTGDRTVDHGPPAADWHRSR